MTDNAAGTLAKVIDRVPSRSPSAEDLGTVSLLRAEERSSSRVQYGSHRSLATAGVCILIPGG